ncbi:hypothetical protein CEXT_251001 [Caerostris extrusa]|uniref:VWFC domain-containing protein n=1 Tax=Caerostris extrusa TaxID=172846 RepID=A0AAV4PZE1_CAEEX|nr:hypothetical protein CEXT_251001 [Caerostris extrusa]
MYAKNALANFEWRMLSQLAQCVDHTVKDLIGWKVLATTVPAMYVINCPLLTCQYPARGNGECCRHCEDCEYSGNYIRNGESFNPETCVDLERNISCKKIDCFHPLCNDPRNRYEQCCKHCQKGCQYDGKDYEDGNTFNPKCTYNGKEYTNGQKWRISNHSCETCACLNGIVSCSEKKTALDKSALMVMYLRESVVLHALIVSIKATQCCTNSLGQPVEYGQKWIHHSDVCQECSCRDGASKCERIACKIPCTHPVMRPDVCCPECNGCQVLGRIYPNNAEIPSVDSCRKCYCYKGNMECESVSCPVMTCENPQKQPGNCCPTCEECHFQGVVVKNGETFQPQSDSCYSCTCDDTLCNPIVSGPIDI